jgi:hypothetical protein
MSTVPRARRAICSPPFCFLLPSQAAAKTKSTVTKTKTKTSAKAEAAAGTVPAAPIPLRRFNLLLKLSLPILCPLQPLLSPSEVPPSSDLRRRLFDLFAPACLYAPFPNLT